ncbi:acyl carrier protein [Pseudanabaena sp. FACHB-2040]|uniref:acyl carrier protein n=1 Tax=Pseudanabaena sp. FACHB-2040 TaxID=2692859 RepID=UPI00168227B8|nr:acyl carrier protein [Pseudanabaena sp. FACHB-2040]MBD2256619.1 acyl carrier protein [Pseudanabaena sp. FACHB-2040]
MEIQNSQISPPTELESSEVTAVDLPAKLPAAAEIQAWIASYLADLLDIDADEVDVTIPFDQYGLDSAAAVGMSGDLEDWLGQKLDPTLLYDYPTVQALAHHLAAS